jgi:hypothetical protein
VEKIDNMLQLRQIVKSRGKDIEDPVCVKYAIASFHSIAWIIISVNVTIYRTVPIQRYQSTNHCILLTSNLGVVSKI